MKNVYLFSTSKHKDVTNINSLSINFLKKDIDFSTYDSLIITSKQVSKYFEFFKITPPLDALAISTKTAQAYEDIGGTILEIGSGYGDNLFELIQKYPKNKRWLYLRAKVVASDFVKKLNDKGYDIQEAIIYESSCSSDILNATVTNNSTLIFTSPSSVQCFLKNHTITKENNVIVIGTTTAKELPSDISYKISPKTTINSCLELII